MENRPLFFVDIIEIENILISSGKKLICWVHICLEFQSWWGLNMPAILILKCNRNKLYRQQNAYMTKAIFTAIMIDLSKYLHQYRPNVKYAVLMDNAACHDMISSFPHDNIDIVMLPPNTTGYLQVCS